MAGHVRPSLALALGVAMLAVPAGAQQPGSAAAEALFQEGQRLLAEGDTEAACRKYEASQKIEPTVGTLLHLADCYEAAGLNASAWAAFRKASYDAAAQRDSRREAVASTRARALEPRLSRIQVKVDPTRRAQGLVVTIGDLEVPEASWGTRLPSDPGPRRVGASAPGHRSWSRVVDVPRTGVIEVAVPELEAANGASREAHAMRSPSRTALVWGTAGVGAAALTAGAAFGWLAYSRNERSLDECRPGDAMRCTAHGVELREEARGYATASSVAFAAGGVLGATALALELTRPRRERGPDSILTFHVRGRGAALELRGAF